MGNLRDSSIFTFTALTALVACSSDDKAKPDAPPIVLLDAAADATPDSPPPIDAKQYDLTCFGMTPPTTAVATITVSGTVQALGLNGATPTVTPLSDALVEGFEVGAPDTALGGSKMSAATTGAFTMDPAPTNDVPLNAYLRASKTAHRTSYVYPPSPLVADQAGTPVLLFTTAAFTALTSFLSISQSPTNGSIAVIVTDCANDPIEGAVVKVQQNGADAGGDTLDGGTLGAQGRGVFFTFDVPPGDTQVFATFDGMTFPTHTVKSFAGTTTTTGVRPGP